jgi:membrane protein DedA with SNARE-associated domain
MDSFILHLIESLKYWGVFAGAFIEGPATALAGGFLIKSQFLAFMPALIVHSLGDFSADMFYFLIGRFGDKKIFKWLKRIFHFSDVEVEKMKWKFQRHHLKIIFIGKLTHFLGLPAIIGIGLSNYSWKKFFIFNLIATIIKSTLLISLGYSVGVLWQQQESIISQIGLIVIIIALSLLGYYLIKRRKNEEKI